MSLILRCLMGICLLGIPSGCTHRQLARNTASAATTVKDIQYRMVLDNIAAISCQPGTLPAHVRLADGTVQISNEGGIGGSGGFTLFSSSMSGIEQWGPNASTTISEQWGTDAVEDPIRVYELQVLYRRVLGLPVLPEPNFITQAKREKIELAERKRNSSDSGESEPSREDSKKTKDEELEKQLREAFSAVDYDIPTGWFGLSDKKGIPKNACYIGQDRERYAWVTPAGIDGLATFTLAVATVIKTGEGSERSPSSLMVTP